VAPSATLPKPEVVFLDLGDTLVRAHPSWADVYALTFPDFNIRVNADDFHRAFEEVFAEGEDEGPFEATAEASYRRLTELDGRVFAKLGYERLPPEFYRRVEEVFARRSSWWIFPDVMPALERMRAEGIRLAVISNWSWQAPELLHDLELARHFDGLIVSAHVGYLKPHPGIFEHALAVMRTAPHSAIHVGDSVRADVQGALSAGIQPVLIDRATHSHAGDGPRRPPEGVPLIHDLHGLLDLIGIERPAASAAVR
jgi:putative hydrolase of the HAD superfamily